MKNWNIIYKNILYRLCRYKNEIWERRENDVKTRHFKTCFMIDQKWSMGELNVLVITIYIYIYIYIYILPYYHIIFITIHIHTYTHKYNVSIIEQIKLNFSRTIVLGKCTFVLCVKFFWYFRHRRSHIVRGL